MTAEMTTEMTTEIEKTFFDTFEIKSIKRRTCINAGDCPDGYSMCDTCEYWQIIREDYPEITDHILLELICVLTRWHLDEREPYEIMSINMEQLKNQILSNSLDIAKYATVKNQVQAIFKAVKNA